MKIPVEIIFANRRKRKMVLPSQYLKHIYNVLNEKWFGNRLNKKTLLVWSNLDSEDCIAFECRRADKRFPLILLHEGLKPFPKVVELTILHEMCHKAIPLRYDHGDRFQGEMMRLAKAGAFKDLW